MNFLKIYDIKQVISADIGTLKCNSTNFKKIREMKMVICTRDSTKVLKASLYLLARDGEGFVDFFTKDRKVFPLIDREGLSEGFLLYHH